MANVNLGGGPMKMDTTGVRTGGQALSAAGGDLHSKVDAIVQRIVDAEPAIGTGPDADGFHLGYNLPATDVKTSAAAGTDTLKEFGNGMTKQADYYEETDQKYSQTIRRSSGT